MKFSFEGEHWELVRFAQCIVNGERPRKVKIGGRDVLAAGRTYRVPRGSEDGTDGTDGTVDYGVLGRRGRDVRDGTT